MNDRTANDSFGTMSTGVDIAALQRAAPFRSAVRAAGRAAQQWLLQCNDFRSTQTQLPVTGISIDLTQKVHDAAMPLAPPAELVLRNIVGFAVIAMDMDGRITEWNDAAEQIIGYPAHEALGHSGEMLFTVEDRALGQFTLELCLAMEKGRAENERWHLRRDGRQFWASGLMMPLRDGAGRQYGFLNIMSDRTEAREEAERRDLLMAEMNHRVKNIFAMVQSIASQTARHAATTAEFTASFEQRLAALSQSHDLLVSGDWQHAPLRDLIERSLVAYREPGRVSLEGIAVMLPAHMVVALTLAFHELATNAVKHGALSVPGGTVDVRWTLGAMLMGVRHVDIIWRERNGPPVAPPKRFGFGSQLLERAVRAHAGAALRLEFEPHGLECWISVPVTEPRNGTSTHG